MASTSDFVDLLKCPVCLTIPAASTPVFQCRTGHIVCNQCHPKLGNKCPVCRGSLDNIRNRIAEANISRLPVKCRFEGCTVELTNDDLKKHEQECSKRLVYCIGTLCQKQVPLDCLEDHIFDHHSVCFQFGFDQFDLIYLSCGKSDYPIRWLTLEGHEFFLETIRDEHGMWSFLVYLPKLQIEADNFKWLFEMGLQHGDHMMTYAGKVASIDLINDSKLASYKISLPDDVVKQFVTDLGTLPLKVTIAAGTFPRCPGCYGITSAAGEGATAGRALSYAKVLREGVAKPPSGAPTVSSTILITSKNVESDPEPEDAGEEHVPPPPEINLGDAFALAAINTAATGVETPKRKSKKMKGQKISLTSPAGRGPLLD